jgi:GT2 family glycosyltransferase/glycosyltransferase involved in cell wall biosynthesis
MRILLVVHGFPPAANGGTEVYVRDLALALSTSALDHVSVLTRDADPHRPELSVRRWREGSVAIAAINNTFQSCAEFEDSYANPGLLRVASDLLDDLRPDVVHVQHLTCLSTGLLQEIAARRIPLLMTLNDYWLICHRGQLLDLDGRRCEGPFDGGCARCLPAGALTGAASYRAGRFLRGLPVPGAAAAVRVAAAAVEAVTSPANTRPASAARLRHMQAAAGHVDLFLVPSRTIAGRFQQFGIPADRLARCDQGIALAPFEGLVRTSSEVLRVGFAGGLFPSKAPHVLLDAVDQLPAGSILIDLLGSGGAYHGDDDYATALESRLGHPAIRRLGPIPHERMPAALHELDVVVVPSIWIENAPFIIREAFAAGAPVIASDLGGMAEMVRDGVDGLLFSAGDARALAGQLRRLIQETGLLDRLRSGIRRPTSIDDEADALRLVYGRLATRRTLAPTVQSAAARSDAPALAAVVLNYRTPQQTWLAVRSLQTSFMRPSLTFVVDNGSGDESAAALGRSLADVSVIETGANLGFSGGCNAGIRAALAAGAEQVMLVNSDAVLAPDAIDHLVNAMRRDATLGIVAPVLLSREEPDHVASAGIMFSRRTGRMRHYGAGMPVSSLTPGPVRVVDAVSGCVMLIRAAVFERAGLLDVDYFFSFEDIDFCLRAAGAGFRTACVQESMAYHEGGHSIGRRSARRAYFATRNHLRLAARAGAPRGRRLRSGFIVGLNAAYVLVAPEVPLVRGLGALTRGVWHHVTGRYGPD